LTAVSAYYSYWPIDPTRKQLLDLLELRCNCAAGKVERSYHDIMISYQHHYKSTVKEIQQQLEEDYSIWIDEKDMGM